MPPNVLAQEEQLTARVKERAGVQAAGSLECLLRRRQLFREPKNHLGIDGRRSFDRRKLLASPPRSWLCRKFRSSMS